MARKLVSYFVHSIDGVVDDPQDWVFDRFDDEMVGHLKAIIDRQDAVLLGRNTYEAWSEHWPTSNHEPFASFINGTPKYVATNTLKELSWEGSTILDGDVMSRIGELKQQPGREIGVHGSATLVRSLVEASLLDELKLALFPAIAGQGPRLFEELSGPRRMDLVEVERTGAGVLVLTYAR